MDLIAAIKRTTDWEREEEDKPRMSAIENVLGIREELAGFAGSVNLGGAEDDAAFEMVLAATPAELAAALIALTTDPTSGY